MDMVYESGCTETFWFLRKWNMGCGQSYPMTSNTIHDPGDYCKPPVVIVTLF